MVVRALVVAVLAGGLLAVPGGTTAARPQDEGGEKAKAKPAGAARLVGLLQTARVTDFPKDLTQTPLAEVLADLGKRFDVTFVVNKSAFADGPLADDTKATSLSNNRLDGLTLHTFLATYLRGLSVPEVTYLVRDEYIEITGVAAAQKEAGLVEAMELAEGSEDAGEAARVRARLTLPLVCVAVENAKLPEVVRTLSRVYGLNVTVEKSAQEAAGQAVLTERLLNVPADTALELLAAQAGLEVVRKGNTFRLTGGGGV